MNKTDFWLDARRWDAVREQWIVAAHMTSHSVRTVVKSFYVDGWQVFTPRYHDRAAVTIASWWQSPRGHGAIMATLATMGLAYADPVVEAAAHFQRHEATSQQERDQLSYLAAWVAERRHEPYPHHAGRLIGCRGCRARCYCEDLFRTAPCVRCESHRLH